MVRVYLAKLVVKSALALFASCLLFANLIDRLRDPRFRLFLQADSCYQTALILDVVLLAILCVTGEELLRYFAFKRLHRFYRHLFLFVIGSGMLSILPGILLHQNLVFFLWMIMIAVIFIIYIRGYETILQRVRSAALFCLLLPIFLGWQLFAWRPTVPPPSRPAVPPPSATTARARHPVFILLFDELSYSRSFLDGELLRSLPNLRRLAGQSFVFHNARSMSKGTLISVPNILFMKTLKVNYDSGSPVFDDEGHKIPTTEVPSLIQAAHERGYNTTMIGWYLPAPAMFGNQVDVYQYASGWPGNGLASNMFRVACDSLQFTHDPLSRPFRHASNDRIHVARTRELYRNSIDLIQNCPASTFAFIHWNVPHFPFVFHADGSHKYFWRPDSAPDYLGQIQYLDHLLGLLTAELRASGKFDDALIVVLSDHGWREERDPKILAEPDSVFHIPLLVKWPGQRASRSVMSQVTTTQVGSLVVAALDGRDEAGAAQVIEELAKAAPAKAFPEVSNGSGGSSSLSSKP